MMTQVQQKGTLAQICAGEVCHAIFSAKTLGLLAHILNQLGPHDSFRKAGKVLDQGSHRELTARFVAFDDQRFQVGACSVKCRGVSRAPGADDDNVASFTHGCFVCRLDGDLAILIRVPHTHEIGAKRNHLGGGTVFLILEVPVAAFPAVDAVFCVPPIFASSSGTTLFTPSKPR